jgi:hypothetical protein
VLLLGQGLVVLFLQPGQLLLQLLHVALLLLPVLPLLLACVQPGIHILRHGMASIGQGLLQLLLQGSALPVQPLHGFGLQALLLQAVRRLLLQGQFCLGRLLLLLALLLVLHRLLPAQGGGFGLLHGLLGLLQLLHGLRHSGLQAGWLLPVPYQQGQRGRQRLPLLQCLLLPFLLCLPLLLQAGQLLLCSTQSQTGLLAFSLHCFQPGLISVTPCLAAEASAAW